jgi:hypothetical protein
MMGALEQGPAKVEEDQDEQDGLNEQKEIGVELRSS